MILRGILLAACGVAGSVFARGEGPVWLPGFEHGGVDAPVYDLVMYDPDGDGPRAVALYACGEFYWAGGRACGGVASWDGCEWSPAAAPQKFFRIHDLQVFDADGPGPLSPALVAIGMFTQIDGVPASCIAILRDGAWTALGEGIVQSQDSVAWCAAVFDADGDGPQPPALYIGGNFQLAPGGPAVLVARWGGSAWSPVAYANGGPESYIRTMLVCDDDGPGPRAPSLVVAGYFQSVEGLSATSIARWDGHTWAAAGDGLPGWNGVSSLAVFDPDGDGPMAPALHAGGFFDKAQGAPADYLAVWDGTAWAEAGGGTPYEIYELCTADVNGDGSAELVASTWFEGLDGIESTVVGAWDGASWHAVGELNVGVEVIDSLDIDGPGPDAPSLYMGEYTWNGPDYMGFGGVAQWTGSEWRGLGSGASNYVRAILAIDDRPGVPAGVYIGGGFRQVAGGWAERIAYWTGSEWSALGEGVEGSVLAMTVFDGNGDNRDELYVGGGLYRVGQEAARGLGRWDGESWRAIGYFDAGNQSVATTAIARFDDDGDGPLPPALFAAGHFATVDGVTVNGIARFDGDHWAALGVGLTPNYVRAWALCVFDEDGPGPREAALFVGGEFKNAGGVGAFGLARWDGQAWSAVVDAVGGVTGWVFALATWDPDGKGPEPELLCVGGQFVSAGGSKSRGIAAWDGQAWRPFAEGLDVVRSIAAFDPDGDGTRPNRLHADANVWDGESWSVMDGGTNGTVHVLATCDEDGTGPLSQRLWVGGYFTLVGDRSSGNLARWGLPYSPCPADCDLSGSLDLLDYLCFSALFDSADPAADCDGSGALDLFDFLCFVNSFNAGCP